MGGNFSKGLEDAANLVGKDIVKGFDAGAKLFKDFPNLLGDILSGNWSNIPKDAMSTLGDVFHMAQAAVDTVIDPAVKIGLTGIGETLRPLGGSKAADYLESDKGQRAGKLVASIALLAVPGVGEAELAAEGSEMAEASEGLANSLKTARSATQEGLESVEGSEAEVSEARTQQENAINRAKTESENLTAKAKNPENFKNTRKGLINKYAKKVGKMGLKQNVIDEAVRLLLHSGTPPENPPKTPEPIVSIVGFFILILSIIFIFLSFYKSSLIYVALIFFLIGLSLIISTRLFVK